MQFCLCVHLQYTLSVFGSGLSEFVVCYCTVRELSLELGNSAGAKRLLFPILLSSLQLYLFLCLCCCLCHSRDFVYVLAWRLSRVEATIFDTHKLDKHLLRRPRQVLAVFVRLATAVLVKGFVEFKPSWLCDQQIHSHWFNEDEIRLAKTFLVVAL